MGDAGYFQDDDVNGIDIDVDKEDEHADVDANDNASGESIKSGRNGK